jgi:hypothetical protein
MRVRLCLYSCSTAREFTDIQIIKQRDSERKLMRHSAAFHNAVLRYASANTQYEYLLQRSALSFQTAALR